MLKTSKTVTYEQRQDKNNKKVRKDPNDTLEKKSKGKVEKLLNEIEVTAPKMNLTNLGNKLDLEKRQPIKIESENKRKNSKY